MADLRDYKALFNQSGIRKQLHISFLKSSIVLKDEDIVSESMEISESLCSGTELRFGSCESSVFKLRIIGNVVPLIGETFTVSMYVGDIAEPFALGTYKVASDKPTADRRFRDIVAYDAMNDIIKADVAAWYNDILPNKDSTTTLRAFRDSFAAYFGVEQEEITLPNDEMVVERTIDPEVISGKDVLSAICEINGCFGHIGRNGKMQYVFLPEIVSGLYPMDTLYPAEDLFPTEPMGTEKISAAHYISCKYEDYTTKRIGKLQIRQEENDIGCIIGEGENCYIVQDNFLVYGKDAAGLQAIGQKLFDIISVVWYRPATVKAIGNPCLKVGAGIRVCTQFEIVETYILERTLKGIHALSDSYEAQGEEVYSENVNGVQKEIRQLKGKTNNLIRTVEETRSTISDVEKGLKSEIKQTADQISSEVTRATGTEKELSSKITQTAEEIRAEMTNADSGLHSEIEQTASAIRLEISDLSGDVYSEIEQLTNAISLRVTSGEVQSMIDITLDSIVLQADQINLNGYVSAGGGNFTIDENGNIKLIAGGATNTVVEVGESGVEVSGSTGVGTWQSHYGPSGIFMRLGGNLAARAGIDTNGNYEITTYGGNFVWNGNTVLTMSNFTLDFNNPKTQITYTSVGNINIMSTNGYRAEQDYKYGNIASTGWVQGKVASLNDSISRLFDNLAAFDARLSTLEAKVV